MTGQGNKAISDGTSLDQCMETGDIKNGVPLARCASPVHVHVDEQTPVHVHVKKPRNIPSHTTGQNSESMLSHHPQAGDHEMLKQRKSRSKSPGHFSGVSGVFNVPWIPPPAKTSKSTRHAWQGSSHRLDGHTAADDGCSQLLSGLNCPDDPDTDEEGRIQSRVRQYEKRIETLMKQVSTLKKELQLQNQKQDGVACGDEDADTTAHQLLKQLDKMDRCSDSVLKQMSTLSEALQCHKKESKRGLDVATLSTTVINNRQLLLDKLAALDTNGQRLRTLLKAQRDREVAQERIAGHRLQLLDQVKCLEVAYESSQRELAEKSTQIAELKLLNDMHKDEVTGANELQGSMELNNVQLQKQLRQREVEYSQTALELRNVQNELSQERAEVEHLRSVVDSRQKSNRKREACLAEEVKSLQASDRESQRIELNSLKTYCDKLNTEKSQAVQEASVLNVRVRELEMVIEKMSEDAKKELLTVTARLQEKISEVAAADEDVERLQTKLSTLEYKLAQACTDAGDLQCKVREYEQLIEEYRGQMTRSRRETEEVLSRLEESRRELYLLRQDSDVELDKVKHHMQSRLSELEPMPELLKSAEVKVQQLTDQLEHYTKLNEGNSRLIAELTAKVDQQAENEAEKRDLLRRLADREETIHQANIQVQEVMCDNATLKRRLESLLADNQRKADLERDKVTSRERAQRAQIMDLETQLHQTQTEMTRLKRDKDESERRVNSQLYDLRDRLEQAKSTNRSLQNYVEFLKNSYTSVFADHITSAPLGQVSSTSVTSPSTTLYHRAV